MQKCNCISCRISNALEKGEIDKQMADLFLLGYHYYGMTHNKCSVDSGWHAEGVEYYLSVLPPSEKTGNFIKVLTGKERKCNQKNESSC